MARIRCRRLAGFLSAGVVFVAAGAAARIANDAPAFGTHLPVPGISGSLVLCGGGELPDAVRGQFIELAGGIEGAHIVVIPTANRAADDEDAEAVVLQPWRDLGLASLTMLHTRSRAEADDEAFVAQLRAATGVWFTEGGQGRLVQRYRDTAVHRELTALLDRGGVIGGNSAGASAMSDVMISAGDDPQQTGRGFGFLPGAIIDQHSVDRNRLTRMRHALAEHPDQFGVGLSERTALVVRGRRGRVIGESSVTVLHAASPNRPERVQEFAAGRIVDLIALSRAAVARAGDLFPADQPEPPVVENGTLIIGGGGRMSRAIMERFIEAAGGADAPIVVIPTAVGGEPGPRQGVGDVRRLQAAGARNVVVLDARTPEDAERPDALEPLIDAGGIWFGGGRQWRLVDSYLDTRAHELMHEVLRRGGVIGGSSAGASIQAEYMVRGHPLGNTVMMAEGYERGLGFMPGVAIDQHFSQRNRFADLAGVKRTFPQLLCIGLDESTVVIVHGNVMEVAGENRVMVYDRDEPAANGDPEFRVLEVGDRYDLKARRPIPTDPPGDD